MAAAKALKAAKAAKAAMVAMEEEGKLKVSSWWGLLQMVVAVEVEGVVALKGVMAMEVCEEIFVANG